MLRCGIVFLLLIFSTAYGKVYDCFLFFNEFEILEMRLSELYDHVDHFVIVEASEGFRGHPKPYNFEIAKDRYERFSDKIIYIKLDEHVETDNPWIREHWQRDQIARGLTDCAPEDLILISDVDEYIPGILIRSLKTCCRYYPFIGFWQTMYRHFLNRFDDQPWAGTIAFRYHFLMGSTPQAIRNITIRQNQRIREGKREDIPMWREGWHFTSMGGYESFSEKWLNFSHGTDDLYPYERWRNEVNEYELVEIDETYPKFVLENIDYFIDVGLIDIEDS